MRSAQQNIMLLKIVAGVFTLASILLAWNVWQTLQNSVISNAKVISVETRSVRVNNNNMKLFYHPIVAFEDATGKRNTIILEEGTQVRYFSAGDAVMILYPKDRPEQARIREWWGLLSPLLLSVLIAALSFYFARVQPVPVAHKESTLP